MCFCVISRSPVSWDYFFLDYHVCCFCASNMCRCVDMFGSVSWMKLGHFRGIPWSFDAARLKPGKSKLVKHDETCTLRILHVYDTPWYTHCSLQVCKNVEWVHVSVSFFLKSTTETQQNQTFQLDLFQKKNPHRTRMISTTLQDQRRMGCKPNYAVCLLQHPERELCITGFLGSVSYSTCRSAAAPKKTCWNSSPKKPFCV